MKHQDDGLVAKGRLQRILESGKVTQAYSRGASSRRGLASQVLVMCQTGKRWGGSVMVGQAQDDGFVAKG